MSVLLEHADKSTFISSSSQGSSLWVFYFFLIPFSVSKFNLKYKTKLQSDFFFDFEAFSLAEIQYKNLQCWIYEFLPTVPRVHLHCAQYMCLSFTPAVPLSQNLLHQARVSNVGLGEGKKWLSFFFYILHSHKTSRSIWVNTAFPLSSYKQLLPPLNQPGIRGSSGSSRVCFSFCLLNFSFHYYYEIFLSLQLLVALSVHHRGFQEQSPICNRGHTQAKD